LSECEQLGTSHARLAARTEVPLAAARYLDQHTLPKQVVGWPSLADLDWPAAGIDYACRAATGDDAVGITGVFCAIAETGTLLLLGHRDTPKATALLPETHLCVVDPARIVLTMEEAFALLRAEVGEPPRALFMVSGPSRTADIEQTIVIGAHGPYRVHVLLLG
jgi:L-lactate dehydrogenase complex protein LldG